MSFAEMERGLDDVLKRSLGAPMQKPGVPNGIYADTRNETNPVLSETHGVLEQTRNLTVRVMDLADRLCGTRPGGAETHDARPTEGVFGVLRGELRDTRQCLVFAD